MKPETEFKSRFLPYVRQPDQLRVGVFLTSLDQPTWVARILTHLKHSSFIELSQIILCERDLRSDPTPSFRAGTPLLWQVVEKFDKFRHLDQVGSTEKRDIRPILKSIPTVKIEADLQSGNGSPSKEILAQIQKSNLDIILYFGLPPIPQDLFKTARFGIWPYFHRFIHWQIPSTAPEYLLKFYEYGQAAFKNDPYFSVFPPESQPIAGPPNNKNALSFIWKAIKQYIVDNIYEHTHADRYELAYQLDHTPDLNDLKIRPEHRLIPPIHKIYGDPFPVEKDGKFYLFFEEMFTFNPVLSGTISLTEIDPQTGKAGKIRQVLKRNYHLSYPMIFKWENEFYMTPETGQNKTIELFRAAPFPDKWEFVKVLIPDVKARDTTIFEKDGKFWLFTCYSERNPDIGDYVSEQLYYSLHIFSAETPLGPWKAHPGNPVKQDSRNTRSAGHIFNWNGEWIRPVQDCSPYYGYAVIFNRIDVLNDETYQETEIGKLLPPRVRGMIGVHTFNHCHGMTVIDLYRYRGIIG
jgi:hypothetical protein